MRLKVVHIVTRLDYGGAQQNTLYTVRHLDRARFEPVLVTGPGGHLDRGLPDLAARGVRARVVPDLVRHIHPLRDLIALLELWRVLREEAPAAVHTHSSKAGILGRIAARLAGVPAIVHTFHGFGFHDRQHPLVRGLYLLAERAAAAVSHRLVFVSRANMEEARRRGIGDPSSYVLIRSGVRLSDYPAPLRDPKAKRAALGIRRDPPLVVGVGNLKPQKNPEDFLRAARLVAEARPQVSFAYVGDGPLRARLESRLLAWNLHGKVKLLGWRDDVAQLLAAADVFLLTSLWEGLPRALVEAMKTGLPCVCYATDGVRDLVRDGENGYAPAPGDWETAGRRVLELLADPALRRRMGQAAADSIGPEFDIDGMVRAQERMLDELAGRAPRIEAAA